MVPIRSILALQLLVLFLTTISFNVVVLGVASKHPSPPPPPSAISVPPALAPIALPPTIIEPPPLPPPPPIGKLLISVEGVVYCRYCKFPGYDKILNASPLRGALAKLVCYNKKEKRGIVVTTKTDRRGYFLIQSKKLSGFQARSCKVVVTSPLKVCSKLLYPGFPLRFERVVKVGKTQIALFTAGFFEFAPPYGTKCKL
ncbi:Pistil-specific extensin-like protein [Dioscorea alata]|uniref:Pistil-specific extensin-like protein n=1 Tax=Dioscorea alata TaxID=55571 RepID=A0ACB7TUH2_DIOAL|nr:Pistil-specific extensin-like protein [Dioscorea alata]